MKNSVFRGHKAYTYQTHLRFLHRKTSINFQIQIIFGKMRPQIQPFSTYLNGAI